MRARNSACLALVLVCAGCYAERVVGKSGVPAPKAGRATKPPVVAPKPRTPTLIRPKEHETLQADSLLGDVDGDGLDDFLIRGMSLTTDAFTEDTPVTYYLFYGRSDFPPQLSTEDADAVFQAGERAISGPLGDINGDGLADFALGRHGTVEFVFGRRERLEGTVAPFSAGPFWQHPGLGSPFADGYLGDLSVTRANDLNGDGVDDLVVRSSSALPEERWDLGVGIGLVTTSYLVLGARGQWRSAMWDPAWAFAEFGYEFPPSESPNERPRASFLSAVGSGDLDGDGRGDLVVQSTWEGGFYVYYGGKKLTGTIGREQADAVLRWPLNYTLMPFADIDGDDAVDVVLGTGSDVAITYGKRWSGDVELATDLMLSLEPKFVYIVGGVAAADTDGDQLQDLELGIARYNWSDFGLDTSVPPELRMYLLRGTGERLRGRIQLDDRYLAPAEVAPIPAVSSGSGWTLTVAGDVDGDGGREILSTVGPGELSPGDVTLIPSTPRRPE